MMPPSALLTDLYQITMAEAYWKLGLDKRPSVFNLFFRENPFQGGYAIACGLEQVIRFIQDYHFSLDDISYLASLQSQVGKPLLSSEFLTKLSSLRLTLNIEAIPEGSVVFPKEPLIQVKGSLMECQLIETTLLNLINFQTLIATKAARVCYAAGGDKVIEFGLRRAQGPNGGLLASRAAFVGGVQATSNVLAGKTFGIPPRGTHAHSFIMAFDNEMDAFLGYAKAFPENCIFLVDTYHTIEGVNNAILVGKKLRENGHRLLGIRLDSGDLAELSKKARALLDEHGFSDVEIMASGDLDEFEIEKLKANGAKISSFGVGTRLVTGFDQAALGGVYKLSAIQDKDGHWQNKFKQSDDPYKQTMPGIFNVKRLSREGKFVGDIISQQKPEDKNAESLLVPIFQEGNLVYSLPTLVDIQARTNDQLQRLPEEILALKPLKQYPVEWQK